MYASIRESFTPLLNNNTTNPPVANPNASTASGTTASGTTASGTTASGTTATSMTATATGKPTMTAMSTGAPPATAPAAPVATPAPTTAPSPRDPSPTVTNPKDDTVIATRVTMMWLNIWFVKMYEKLGWMGLSLTEGKRKKVKGYVHTLKELLASAEKKEKHTTDFDRKNDIQILITKIKDLRTFARTLFKNISSTEERAPGNAKERTFIALNKWYAKKYKKLGWMALLKSEGSVKEIKSYVSNIADLHATILKKMKEIKDDDKLYDLKIILRNTEKLRNFADILLS